MTTEIAYDAPLPRVFAMVTDPAFHEHRCRAEGSLEHRAEVTTAPDGVVQVSVTRVLPATDLPDIARSFVGTTLTVTEVGRWAGDDGGDRRDGTVEVTIAGAPVRFTARVTLQSTGAGTVQRLDGELKASVPLVGSRIERAAEPAIRAAFEVQHRTGVGWLADH